jgi:hypothetical protein
MNKGIAFVCFLLITIPALAQRQFITLWDTRVAAKTGEKQIEYLWVQEKKGKVEKFDIYWEKNDNPAIKGKASLKPDDRLINLPEPGLYKLVYNIPESEDDVMKKSWGAYKINRWTGENDKSPYDPPSNFFTLVTDAPKLIDVLYWSTPKEGKNLEALRITAAHFFYGCSNLDISASDRIKVGAYAQGMFSGCKKLKGNYYFKFWELVSLEDCREMFAGCEQFTDAPIEYWDMSKLRRADFMFKNCINFNRPIGYWNVQELVYMRGMFHGAKRFNQNLSGWNMYAFIKKTLERESTTQYYLDKNKRMPYTYLFDTVNNMPTSYMPHISDEYTSSVVARDMCVETLFAIRKNYNDNCKSVEEYLKSYYDALASGSGQGEREYKKSVFSYADYAITNLKSLQMEMEKCSVFNKLFTAYAKEIPEKISEIEQFKTRFGQESKVNLFNALILGFENAVKNYQ